MIMMFNSVERYEIRRCRKGLARIHDMAAKINRKSMDLTDRAITMLAKDTFMEIYESKQPSRQCRHDMVERVLSIIG